jgi:hypothetical protein
MGWNFSRDLCIDEMSLDESDLDTGAWIYSTVVESV